MIEIASSFSRGQQQRAGDDDRSPYFAVPMPTREGLGQFVEPLAALLGSMQGNISSLHLVGEVLQG